MSKKVEMTQRNLKLPVWQNEKIEEKAKAAGFSSVSNYMVYVAMNAEIKVTAPSPKKS